MSREKDKRLCSSKKKSTGTSKGKLKASQMSAGPAMTVSAPEHRFVCRFLVWQQAVGAEGCDNPVLF